MRQLSKSSEVTSDRSSSPSLISLKILSTSWPEFRPLWSSVAHFCVPEFSFDRELSVGALFCSVRSISWVCFEWLPWFRPFLLLMITGTDAWSRLDGRDWLRTIDGIWISSVEKSGIELFELKSLRSIITGCWVRFRFAGGSPRIIFILGSWFRSWLVAWSRRVSWLGLSKLGIMMGSSSTGSRFGLGLTRLTIGLRLSSNTDDREFGFWTTGSLLGIVTISLKSRCRVRIKLKTYLRGISSFPSSSTSPWMNFQHFVSNFFNLRALSRLKVKVSYLFYYNWKDYWTEPSLCCFSKWDHIFCLYLKSSCVDILNQMPNTLYGNFHGSKPVAGLYSKRLMKHKIYQSPFYGPYYMVHI